MAARSLNKAQIIGNLTRDPELRYTAKGTSICTFGVATNRMYTPSDATEPTEEAEFHNVVAWAKLAELCSQLLHKGWKVFIEGRLNTRSWQDSETGKKMYRTEIVASDMIVLGAPRSATTPRPSATVTEAAEVTPKEKPEQPEQPEAATAAAATKVPVPAAPKTPPSAEKKTKSSKASEEVTDDEVKAMPF